MLHGILRAGEPSTTICRFRRVPASPHDFLGLGDVDEHRLRPARRRAASGQLPAATAGAGRPDDFHDETYDSPSIYLVAEDYAGLCRVWLDKPPPRLGFVGVRREHRREGLAASARHGGAGRGRRARSRAGDRRSGRGERGLAGQLGAALPTRPYRLGRSSAQRSTPASAPSGGQTPRRDARWAGVAARRGRSTPRP